MKKQVKEKYISNASFEKESGWVRNEFKNVRSEFKDLKDQAGRMTVQLIQHGEDIQYLKENSATKQDISMLIGKIDSFINKTNEFDQEQLVQGLHIKELKETTKHHEARIFSLEASKPIQ